MNKIFEFDTLIYPVKIWIVVNPDLDGLTKTFNLTIEEMPKGLKAKVDCVSHQDDCGVLIRFADKQSINFKSAAHESAHAALRIFEKVGAKLTMDSDEIFAHLCGFVADCIQQVLLDKAKVTLT